MEELRARISSAVVLPDQAEPRTERSRRGSWAVCAHSSPLAPSVDSHEIVPFGVFGHLAGCCGSKPGGAAVWLSFVPMSTLANGTFEVHLEPGPAELDGAVGRFDLTKTFKGDLQGAGTGVMLSCGDPQSGSAGYVAVETVRGQLGDRQGGFALQQFGTIHGGSQTLHYEVVPGSGEGDLNGITGRLRLTIDSDGTHHYELEYDL